LSGTRKAAAECSARLPLNPALRRDTSNNARICSAKKAFTPHPGAETGVVQLAAAHVADAAQHLVPPVREMALKPRLEERRHSPGEPQRHITRALRARSRGGGE